MPLNKGGEFITFRTTYRQISFAALLLLFIFAVVLVKKKPLVSTGGFVIDSCGSPRIRGGLTDPTHFRCRKRAVFVPAVMLMPAVEDVILDAAGRHTQPFDAHLLPSPVGRDDDVQPALILLHSVSATPVSYRAAFFELMQILRIRVLWGYLHGSVNL